MFGPNHILVTMSWDNRLSPGHGNVCRWFFNVSWKTFKMGFKVLTLVKISV